MSAIETTDGRVQDAVEHVASVTTLPSRTTPDPAPAPSLPVPHLPSMSEVAALVTPPDIWSDDRPSLRKIWLYARYGRWTDASGPLRVAGAAWAFVAMAVTTVLYLVGWIFERPARFAIAAALAGLIKLAL
jgi:hypothetical protein